MKILLINNNVFYEKADGLYLHKSTGEFAEELLSYVKVVLLFQLKLRVYDNDGLANYNISNKGFKIRASTKHKSKLLTYFSSFFVGLRALIESDYIYCFYPTGAPKYLLLTAAFWGKPFGLYVRGEKDIHSKTSRFLFRKATVCLTVSPDLTNLVNDSGGVGCTIRPMIEYSEKDINTTRVYVPKPVFKILYLGRLEKAKGLFELLDAIEALKSDGETKFVLNIVGNGPDSDAIKNYSDEKKLGDVVFFHSPIYQPDAKKQLFLDSDMFVLPTHHEGFPRVLYECMILGLPIITTFVGSIGGLMKDNYNCIQINALDHRSIANKIKFLINNYKLSSFIAKNATKTIKEYLTNEKLSHAEQLVNWVRGSLKIHT